MQSSPHAQHRSSITRRSGRPRRGTAPSITFGVRLTGGEYGEIAAAAAALEVTITALMRTSALITARMAPALLAQEAVAVWRAGQAASEAAQAVRQLARDLPEVVESEDLRRAIDELADAIAVCRDGYHALTAAHHRRASVARQALQPDRARFRGSRRQKG